MPCWIRSGETGKRSWQTLRPGGTLVAITAPIAKDPLRPANTNGVFFIVRPNRAELVEIAMLIDAREVRSVVEATYALSDGRQAFERAAAGHLNGKSSSALANDAGNGCRLPVNDELVPAGCDAESPSKAQALRESRSCGVQPHRFQFPSLLFGSCDQILIVERFKLWLMLGGRREARHNNLFPSTPIETNSADSRRRNGPVAGSPRRSFSSTIFPAIHVETFLGTLWEMPSRP